MLGARVSDVKVEPGCKQLWDKATGKPGKRTVCTHGERENFGEVLEGIEDDIPANVS